MTLTQQQSNLLFGDNSDDKFVGRKPFLKWAGNKNRVKHHIVPRLPKGRRLVEPFAGSCAISLASDFESYLIADTNADLIDMYQFIKIDANAVIEEAEKLFVPSNNEAEAFYRLRLEFNEAVTSLRKSALFIYLNRHCFNGLCRYNASGGFNVPFGKYSGPSCPSADILRFAEFAKRCEFHHQSFQDTFSMTVSGDVIYCDPPYIPLSATSNFTSYSKDAFGPDLQILLAELAFNASENGRPTLVSNHNTPFAEKIYATAHVEKFDVQRLISSKAATRGTAPELLAIYSV
jgi:DNA adenine methylase